MVSFVEPGVSVGPPMDKNRLLDGIESQEFLNMSFFAIIFLIFFCFSGKHSMARRRYTLSLFDNYIMECPSVHIIFSVLQTNINCKL